MLRVANPILKEQDEIVDERRGGEHARRNSVVRVGLAVHHEDRDEPPNERCRRKNGGRVAKFLDLFNLGRNLRGVRFQLLRNLEPIDICEAPPDEQGPNENVPLDHDDHPVRVDIVNRRLVHSGLQLPADQFSKENPNHANAGQNFGPARGRALRSPVHNGDPGRHQHYQNANHRRHVKRHEELLHI